MPGKFYSFDMGDYHFVVLDTNFAMEHIMVAKQKGLRFLAITDHTGIMPGSPNEVYFSTLCNSLPEEYDGVYLLRGCEANIIDANGTLDLPEWILKRLDLVIASIHSFVTTPMNFEECTRLWTAIAENPDVDVIGHCGEEGFKFDYEKVIPLFAKNGKIRTLTSILYPQKRKKSTRGALRTFFRKILPIFVMPWYNEKKYTGG